MRSIKLARDDAELLIDLLDTVRGTDFRLDQLNDEIRELFGMVTFDREHEVKKDT